MSQYMLMDVVAGRKGYSEDENNSSASPALLIMCIATISFIVWKASMKRRRTSR